MISRPRKSVRWGLYDHKTRQYPSYQNCSSYVSTKTGRRGRWDSFLWETLSKWGLTSSHSPKLEPRMYLLSLKRGQPSHFLESWWQRLQKSQAIVLTMEYLGYSMSSQVCDIKIFIDCCSSAFIISYSPTTTSSSTTLEYIYQRCSRVWALIYNMHCNLGIAML